MLQELRPVQLVLDESIPGGELDDDGDVAPVEIPPTNLSFLWCADCPVLLPPELRLWFKT